MAQPWEITTPMWTSGSKCRGTTDESSRLIYEEICAHFDVVNAPEFQPSVSPSGEVLTRCNYYVELCTKALGCPIPHYWFKRLSEDQLQKIQDFMKQMGVGGGVPFDELGANKQNDWLHTVGSKHGWFFVDVVRAANLAFRGFPVVATWKNVPGKGPGHIAMVLSDDGEELLVAQAGAQCLWKQPIVKGFGPYLPQVQYATHS